MYYCLGKYRYTSDPSKKVSASIGYIAHCCSSDTDSADRFYTSVYAFRCIEMFREFSILNRVYTTYNTRRSTRISKQLLKFHYQMKVLQSPRAV